MLNVNNRKKTCYKWLTVPGSNSDNLYLYLYNNVETCDNRRAVYQILEEQGIDLPRYAVLDRDSNHSRGTGKCYHLITLFHLIGI